MSYHLPHHEQQYLGLPAFSEKKIYTALFPTTSFLHPLVRLNPWGTFRIINMQRYDFQSDSSELSTWRCSCLLLSKQKKDGGKLDVHCIKAKVCEKTWEKQILLEYEMQQAAQAATETLLLKATQQCYTGRIGGTITRSTR